MRTAGIDFETKSAVNLKKAGVDRYAEDLTTGIWCLAWTLDDLNFPVWEPGDPDPTPLLDHIENGGMVSAWNSYFEETIWLHVIPRICPKWPKLRTEQLDDTMARAYAMALPGSLEWCARAMRIPAEKDKQGHALMMLMCAPRRTWKAKPEGPPTWYDERERIDRLKAYCAQDVRVERALAKKIAPLSKRERKVWLLDQRINRRGVQLDIPSINAAADIVTQESARLNRELRDVTKEAVSSAAAPVGIVNWLRAQGVHAENLRKNTVAGLLKTDLEDEARRVLEIRREAGKASTAKLRAMQASVSADNRARGMFGYHVATTGRWVGRRAQPQNLPRPTLKPHDIEQIIPLFTSEHGADCIRYGYATPLDAISSSLRGMLVPAPGRRFISGDFANIEGRVLAWLAGEQWKLEAFRAYDRGDGPDIYKLAYSRSFGAAIESIDDGQRQIGKVQELALGYQGGPAAFDSMAANYSADIEAIAEATIRAAGDEWDDFWANMLVHKRTPQQYALLRDKYDFDVWVALKYIVTRWRDAHPRTVRLWYDLQECAVNAVQNPGKPVSTDNGMVSFLRTGPMLYCRLPSSRCLHYPEPKIIYETDEITEQRRPSLEYWAWDGIKKQWTTTRGYGGLLAENIDQATSRDVLVDAMFRAEDAQIPIVLHVHDEIVGEVPDNHPVTPETFTELLCASEPWTDGLPVAAKSWTGYRYQKD